jgi:hypothetical protein
VGGGVFALAYGQAPLFYSNQNQYLLHGLAQAGYGHLRDDWLARTADPTPVFSALVTWTWRLLPLETLHLAYAIVQGVYLASLLAVFTWQAGLRGSWRLQAVFAALVILVHAAVVRWLSYRGLGWDYPYYLQGGVAGQYLLGPVFQPSVFGVALLASLAAFSHGWNRSAALLCGLTVLLHSTYLLPAVFLLAGYAIQLLREQRRALAVQTVALGLAAMIPALAYAWRHFGPSDPELFAEAQRILARERIPHHCQPRLWFDGIAGLQLLWILGSFWLVRGTRLFLVLVAAAASAVLLTLLQLATGSDGLALLFPWRLSAVLMPLATGLYLGRLVLAAGHWLEDRFVLAGAAAGAVAAAVAGVWIMAAGLGYQSPEEELPLYAWVRQHAKPGDVYLLPIRVPALAASTRGSLSSDFKPVHQKRTEAKIIPVDLQRFRLMTGVPIYVDFKSVPYREDEVVEWKRRLEANHRLLELLREGPAAAAEEEARRLGISHVLLPAGGSWSVSWPTLYADDAYEVRQVPPPSPTP